MGKEISFNSMAVSWIKVDKVMVIAGTRQTCHAKERMSDHGTDLISNGIYGNTKA